MTALSRRGAGARWRQIDVGVWVPDPYSGAAWTTALSTFDTNAGKRPDVVHTFLGWTDTGTGFPSTWAETVRSRGQILAITWEPWDAANGTATQAAYQLADIIAGTYDSYVTSFAQQAATYARPVLLRFAHEMNGDWYPWSPGVNGNTLGQYAQAWQRVRNIFTAQGATNVRWVWCPNITFTGSGFTAMAGLYPGDAYVDYIGLDGYNFANPDWVEFSDIFTASITEIRATAPTKPLIICETGCSETGGNKATWITNMWTYLAAHPEIRGLWWFNENKENDWRIESTTGARTAFAAGVANTRYAKASA